MSSISTNCFVAFLDVLGFKDMVEHLSHADLHRVYVNLLVSNAATSAAQGKFRVVDTPDGQRAVADFSDSKLRVLVVSDSVLIYSPDDGTASFVNLCAAVGKLLVSGFYSGLPMRGGIAHGEMSVFSGSSGSGEIGVHGIVGMPLVRAYQAESTFAWAGCVIEDDCVERFESQTAQLSRTTPDVVTLEQLQSSGLIVRYPAPLKGDLEATPRWVVNWPRHNRGGISDDAMSKCFTQHGKSTQLPAVQTIIRNTLDFLEFSRRHG